MWDDVRVKVKVDHWPLEVGGSPPIGTDRSHGRIKVVAPNGHSIRVRSIRNWEWLVIEGSFIAFLQGHNVVGTMDLMALVKAVIAVVLAHFKIPVDAGEQQRIDQGRVKLERLDVVGFLKVDELGGAPTVLRALDVGLAGSRANRMIFDRETVVYHSHSPSWSLMGYDKAAQLQAKHPATWARLDGRTQEVATNYLRLELRQFRRELVRQGWDEVRDVQADQVKKVFAKRLAELTNDLRRPYPRLPSAVSRPTTGLLMGLLASLGLDLISGLSPRRQRAIRAELCQKHGIHPRAGHGMPSRYKTTLVQLLDQSHQPIRHGAPRALRRKGWLATLSSGGHHNG